VHITVGADKGFDTTACVDELRAVGSTPHVARNATVRHPSAIDGRTTRHPGYGVSQRKRKRIEEIFGWLKTVGGCRQTRLRGLARVGWMVTFATAVYNLVDAEPPHPNAGLTAARCHHGRTPAASGRPNRSTLR